MTEQRQQHLQWQADSCNATARCASALPSCCHAQVGVAHFTEEQGFKDMYPHQVMTHVHSIVHAAFWHLAMSVAGLELPLGLQSVWH
jgi:uncharacterized membrane protein